MISAYYRKVGAFLKCWRPIEMLALYQNAGALLKCWRPIEMLALY
jgi:hypothetical protein